MTSVKLNLPLDRDSFLVFLKKKKIISSKKAEQNEKL